MGSRAKKERKRAEAALAGEERRGERRVRAAAVAVVLLLGFGVVAPRSAFVDYTLGIEAWRGFGILPFALAAALVLLLAFSRRAAGRAAAGLGRLTDRVPGALRLPVLFAAAAVAFWLLTNHRISGDAMSIVLMAAEGTVQPSNALTSWLHIGLARLPGIDAYDAVRIVACASGLVFLVAAVGIGRAAFPDRARRAGVTALVATSGAAALFFGTLEVYPTLAAGIALYLWAGLRALERDGSPALPGAVLGVTFCLHGSAGLLIPSLALLANRGRLRPVRPRALLAAAVAFLVPVLLAFATLYLLTWDGRIPEHGPGPAGNFLGAMGQGPIVPLVKTTANLPYRYAFLDADHLLGALNLIVLSAPAAVALLFTRRPPRGSAKFSWVATAALFLVVFPFIWCVSFSLRRDWDLFVPMGIPLALLAGLSHFCGAENPGRALAVAGLSIFAFAPFVVSNHLAPVGPYAHDVALAFRLAPPGDEDRERARERWEERSELVPPAEREAHRDAEALWRAGDAKGAVARLESALRRDPGNPRLHGHLGSIHHRTGRPDPARDALFAAVRLDPTLLGAWVELADIAEEAGDEREAVRLLERGLRVTLRDPMIEDAYRRLIRLLEGLGESERARAAKKLARGVGAR